MDKPQRQRYICQTAECKFILLTPRDSGSWCEQVEKDYFRLE
jgi:hypothetical protein